jgi:hypothetical protein
MTTPTHVIANLGLFALLRATAVNPGYADLALILSSNFIDLDHLSARPIYHPRRNPFKTHFFHRSWLILLTLSIVMLFVRPLMFLGFGLILHMALDYIYIKRDGL